MPKVSIIVPNYNHAKYLTKRLDSIFNQTFHDFEVILLDDCSIDNSLEILNNYAKNSKVTHFVINKSNSGSPFKQWKRGIELAKGEFIWIAESDDWCEPEFLSELLAFADLRSSDIVFCGSTFFFQNEHKFENSPDDTIAYENTGKDFLIQKMATQNVMRNASAVVFKRSLPTKFPKKILSFKVAGDWYFWCYIGLKATKISYLPKFLNYFRLHEKSTFFNPPLKSPGLMEGIYILNNIKKAGVKPTDWDRITNIWYLSFLNIIRIDAKSILFNFQLIIDIFKIDRKLSINILRSSIFYFRKQMIHKYRFVKGW